jgi:heme/copper-type cytochrome/quinol oxidase subunit 3
MLKQSILLVPARRDMYQAKMVFYLFLASLSMFFVATLATYFIIRTQAFQPVQRSYEPLRLPITFWISSVILVAVSVLLQRASWLVHRERQQAFRRALMWAWTMAIAFVVVQTLGMRELLAQHFTQTDGSTKVYGMSFTLALIHALHVLGGMVFLIYIIIQSLREKYDHERHWAVDHCAGYWHFLDVVWFTMMVVFVLTE